MHIIVLSLIEIGLTLCEDNSVVFILVSSIRKRAYAICNDFKVC